MSHTAAEGVRDGGRREEKRRILQVVLAARQLADLRQGQGDGRARRARRPHARGRLETAGNDPTGAWEYPPPPRLSPQTLDWDTWQNDVPKRPLIRTSSRAGALEGIRHGGGRRSARPSHQRMMFMLGVNEPPRQAAAVGGIRRWKDGRNMPDVHATIFYYRDSPGLTCG